jgi:phosphoglycerate dehydrogenase-like enzyme
MSLKRYVYQVQLFPLFMQLTNSLSPQEPQIHPGLLVHPRATLLPHIGTNTIEAQIEMEQLALNNLIAAVDSDKLITPVYEHKKYFQ